MNIKIYAIRDAKGEYYNSPWFQQTHGEAERALTQLVRDEKSTIAQFPEDYDLFYLGEFDNKTGLINPELTPKHIAKAIDLKLQ